MARKSEAPVEQEEVAGVPPWVRVVMRVESIARADGVWVRRVSFPDIPEISVEDESVVVAIDRAQELLGQWWVCTDAPTAMERSREVK